MKTLLSTKKLMRAQQELLLNAHVAFVEYDAVKIEFIDFTLPQQTISNVIFTSQNALRATISRLKDKKAIRCFCVGEKTKRKLEENGLNVVMWALNASELAVYIAQNHKNEHFDFFCGNRRRDELPSMLASNHIAFNEIQVYQTVLYPKQFSQRFDALLFFSPSGVQSFVKANQFGESEVICIGPTTASEAKKYTDKITVANSPSIESVIVKAVNKLKEEHD